uniref:Uncharacterized protein n=1 Tax=Leersia perrieri TaxID=77586 RepID=A0A0D9XMX3_9ORYZ
MRGRLDCNPEQGDGDGDEARPDVDDGGRPSPPAHESLCKGVEMRKHPEAEEDSAKKLAPLGDGAVDGAAESDGDGDEVDHDDGERRYHEGGPLDGVELGELVVDVVAELLGGEREGDLDAGDDLEEALQDGGEVGAGAADEPELLVSPPLLQRDARPLDLQHCEQAERDGDDEQVGEECDVERLHDELAREEGQRRQEAVDDEEHGREGVDANVELHKLAIDRLKKNRGIGTALTSSSSSGADRTGTLTN